MNQFERRIYARIFLLAVILISMLGVSFLALWKVVGDQRATILSGSEELQVVGRLQGLNGLSASLLPIYFLTGEERVRENLLQTQEEFRQALEELKNTDQTEAEKELTADIEDDWTRLEKIVRGVSLSSQREGASLSVTEHLNAEYDRASAPILSRLSERLAGLARLEAAEVARTRQHLKRTVDTVIILLWVLSVISLILMAYVGGLIVNAIRQKRSLDEAREKMLEHERKISIARKEAVEVVAHDLRNPVATIKMAVDLVRDALARHEPDGEIRGILDVASRSTESMQRLISDLLDHAKIEAGKLALNFTMTDIGAVVRDLASRFEPTARAKGIILESDVDESVPLCSCDGSRLEQALSNLIGNAVKFTPSGGRVKVSLRKEQDAAALIVEDEGPGIEREVLPHIFERYWQVSETAKQGTGLGLAITKAIVEAHHGEVSVESRLGHGSKFVMKLPIHPSAVESAAPATWNGAMLRAEPPSGMPGPAPI